MDAADRTIEGPVAFVVTRDVKPEAVSQYKSWVSRLGVEARKVDPNLSMTVIKPSNQQNNQYVVVLSFTSYQKLDQWERSDSRRELHGEVKSMEKGKASFKEVTGFEYWFSLPKVAAIRPPARYKMALVTVLGLFALSETYTYTVNRWLHSLPDHLSLVIRILILVTNIALGKEQQLLSY